MGVPVYVENDAGCAALAEAFEDGRMTVAVARDVHDRHRRRRRLGAQRQASTAARRRRPPRSGTRSSGATSSSATTCRATRSRSAARWRRWPPGARWTGWPTTPRSSTATPTSARCSPQKGNIDGHDVVAGAEAGDERVAVVPARAGRAARDRHRERDQHVRPAGGRDRRRRLAGRRAAARARRATPRSGTSCPAWD